MSAIATFNQYAGALALLISIGNWVWGWATRPQRDLAEKIAAGDKANADKLTAALSETDAEIGKVDRKVDGLIAEQGARTDRHREDLKAHDRRIQKLEDDLRHLPTKDDLHAVAHQLTGVKTELDIVAKTVTRIDEHLRSKS